MTSHDRKTLEASLIPADKVYRKKVIFVYVILGSIGVAVIGWGLPWMQKFLQTLGREEALQFMKVVLVMVFLSVIPVALYLFSFGRKVSAAERFPPPGTKVIRDTVVLEGEKAKQRGRLIVVFSLVLALFGLFGALYALHIIDKLAIGMREQPEMEVHSGSRSVTSSRIRPRNGEYAQITREDSQEQARLEAS